MNEEKARLAAEKSRRVHTRRVLMIGGLMDGKWHTHEGGGYQVRILKPMSVMPMPIVTKGLDLDDLSVPMPQYEVYHLSHVALYGEGLWVGLHKDTMDQMDMSPDRGSRDAHTIMILRAILQRDVVTEMGL